MLLPSFDLQDTFMNNIAVLGLGKVGALAAALLHESGFVVKAYD